MGPSLIDSLTVLSKDDFSTTVTPGRLDWGRPSFGGNDMAMRNLDALCADLKGRSRGVITQAPVRPLPA